MKAYLSPHMLDWAVSSECLLNAGVITGSVQDAPVTLKLSPAMRPFYSSSEMEVMYAKDQTAVFEPHKAESGALRFIFSRLEDSKN